MKIHSLVAAAAALAIVVMPFTTGYGQDSDFKPPGTEETAAVEKANTELDKVYKSLMSKLDEQGQKSLKEAQRAWIKWRDTEAALIARVGGAIGGSSLRVDVLNAQQKLIRDRIKVLQEYAKQAAEGN